MNYLSFREICSIFGFRYSTVRAELYEFLLDTSPTPLKNFISEARGRGFDTVSIYRTIDVFRKYKLIDEYGVGNSRIIQLRELESDTHHHYVRCSVCKKATPFHSDKIEQSLNEIALKNDFKNIESHFVELVGVCKNCR
jgi:Fe2+ or Zn2+ uptake regulation protein